MKNHGSDSNFSSSFDVRAPIAYEPSHIARVATSLRTDFSGSNTRRAPDCLQGLRVGRTARRAESRVQGKLALAAAVLLLLHRPVPALLSRYTLQQHVGEQAASSTHCWEYILEKIKK